MQIVHVKTKFICCVSLDYWWHLQERDQRKQVRLRKKKQLWAYFWCLSDLLHEKVVIYVACFPPTCNKRHLSKLFPVKSTCTSTNSIYFQLVKYICKIFYSNTTIYNSQGYLAKGDQLDHRKITTTLDKRVCLSQSVVHKKATQSIKSENW